MTHRRYVGPTGIIGTKQSSHKAEGKQGRQESKAGTKEAKGGGYVW